MQSARYRQYQNDGFYISREPLIEPDLIQRTIEGMDAVRSGEYETGIPPQPSYWNPGDDPKKLCKIEMSQVCNRAIMALVSHPTLGELAAEITGAEMVQVWWVQLLYKPAVLPGEMTGTRIGWHQDRYYWGIWEDDSELLTAWVALSDVTEAAGPMKFVRGSHAWGFLKRGDFYGQDLDTLRKEIVQAEGKVWEEAPAILPPGGVSFHSKLTFHGSDPNVSGQPRRSFAIHMRTEKSRPVDDRREGLTRFIDDPTYCPIVYRRNAPGK